MKLTTLILIAAILQVSATTFAQKVTLNKTNAPLIQIMNEIRVQTGYDFFYDLDIIKKAKPVTIKVKNANLNDVLMECFKQQPLIYEIDDKAVVVTELPKSQTERTKSQLKAINPAGKILTLEGKPVARASIMVIGTRIATATDSEGNFKLVNVPDNSSIIVTAIGYYPITFRYSNGTPSIVKQSPKETDKKNEVDDEAEMNKGRLSVDDSGFIVLQLNTKVSGLQDVVVTGIFNKSRKNYTGAVTTIDEKELKMFKGQNLLATLKNIDPSINVIIDNSLGSDPNRVPDLNIRGNSSLPMSVAELNGGTPSQLNTPLVIMDGFEISMQKLMDFNDEEIQSINILKDASATAIYGSRGANGVIVITTKPPMPGKLRTTAQVGINIEIPDVSSYNLLNASEKLQLEKTVGLYNNSDPEKDRALKQQYNLKLADILSGANTDWLSQPITNAITQRYNLRLEGGADAFRWGTTVSYNTVGGAMKGSERNTFSGSVVLTYSVRNLIFRNQTTIDFTKGTNSKYGSFSTYAQMNPYWKMKDDQGNYIKSYLQIGTTANPIGNPLYDAQQNSFSNSGYNTIINNFSLDWNLSQNLKLRSQFGISKMNSNSDNFISPTSSFFESTAYQGDDNFFRKGKYTKGTSDNVNLNGNVTLSYSKVFAQKHQIYIGLDNSIRQTSGSSLSIITEGFPDDRLTSVTNGLQYGQGTRPSGSESITRSLGITSNANYAYDNRYIVDMSFRADGSSQFGKNSRFAPFWSIGTAWNLHNEAFLKDQEVINSLRIRGSYGETGSQQFSPYQALSTFSYYTDKRYLIWNGAELMGLGNEDLQWQKTNQTDLGAEVGIFGNRLTGTFDVYSKVTSNLLSQMDIPMANGFSSYVANVGEVKNTGWEAMLGGYLIRNPKRNILWSVTAKIAYNKNEITKLSQAIKDQTETAKLQNVDVNRLLYEGYSQNAIWAVPSLGIDPSNGQELFLDAQGNITTTWNPNAKTYVGTADQPYRGNISTMFTYGNFTFNVSFGYHWGGQQYNQTLLGKVEVVTSQLQYNVDRRVLTDRWQKVGDVKPYRGFTGSATRLTSRFVMDDNAFELQSASAQYRWNSKYLKEKFKVDAINFSINTSDLFYISSIKRERGTSYPFARRATLNVSVMF